MSEITKQAKRYATRQYRKYGVVGYIQNMLKLVPLTKQDEKVIAKVEKALQPPKKKAKKK